MKRGNPSNSVRGPGMDSAADYFGSMREEYDSLIARAVPRYTELTNTLLDYLPSRAGTILELGCGTGNFSLVLAASFPEASITFVDASADMIEITRSRLTEKRPGAVENATWLTSRFEDLSLPGESFDLVTSCISLHHVQDKTSFFRKVYSMTVPGGSFRFADQMGGGTGENHDLNWRRWLEYCRLPGNCTEDDITGLLDHAEAHDYYVSVPDHLRILEEAGFESLDCVWRHGMWGVLTADRK